MGESGDRRRLEAVLAEQARLTEAFGRITELYDGVAEDLDDETLHHRPGGTGNPIAWLLWHLARVQDDHIAHLAGTPQVWEEWQERFGLPNDADDIGYGHTNDQVDAIRITDPQLLVDYHHEVTLATARYLQTVDEQELEREVDQSWDPPVTAGAVLAARDACLYDPLSLTTPLR